MKRLGLLSVGALILGVVGYSMKHKMRDFIIESAYKDIYERYGADVAGQFAIDLAEEDDPGLRFVDEYMDYLAFRYGDL